MFDVSVRYGGEEFILILPETGLEAAAIVGERIRTRVQESPVCASRIITVSGGIAECTVDDTADSIIKRADDLLYRAKQSGRNRIISER